MTLRSLVEGRTSRFYGIPHLRWREDVNQQASEAWIKEDARAFATLFLPDGEFIVPNNRWVGQTAIEQVAADFFAPYEVIKIEIRQLIVEDNRAVVEWYWEDREKATGKCNRADDAIVINFKAGKISRWREYIDVRSF